MKVNRKIGVALCALALLMAVFLVGTQSYFNNKEISLASDRCSETGGAPKVERNLLSLSYTFSCE
ncbi:hypothetical protein M3212_11605 [Alkalihalobacillus oceani]|uniref:hypothetical protein n=1 Tax=Halalkalibacter oceani TaxID=1653776 RepID=UPI0020407C95|nr:hypothetical protein [Halalkalibacter oceani]MCM3761429.1 hypothetical protein [Halalkalibacter oceani]